MQKYRHLLTAVATVLVGAALWLTTGHVAGLCLPMAALLGWWAGGLDAA